MLTRRALLTSASALALTGCSASLKTSVGNFADAAYSELVTVARIFEQAIATAAAKTAAAVSAAIAMIKPYIVPVCRICVSMDTLAQTLVANGQLKPAAGSKLAGALGALHATATTSAVAATAQTGAPPSDPVTIAGDLIQLASLVLSLTAGRITPTAAVA